MRWSSRQRTRLTPIWSRNKCASREGDRQTWRATSSSVRSAARISAISSPVWKLEVPSAQELSAVLTALSSTSRANSQASSRTWRSRPGTRVWTWSSQASRLMLPSRLIGWCALTCTIFCLPYGESRPAGLALTFSGPVGLQGLPSPSRITPSPPHVPSAGTCRESRPASAGSPAGPARRHRAPGSPGCRTHRPGAARPVGESP